jgi:hypothetical protein
VSFNKLNSITYNAFKLVSPDTTDSRGNISDKWSVDLSLQLYRQNFVSGMTMKRIMPMFRTAYQISQSVSFDMDAGFELSQIDMGTQVTDGRRQFFSLGFRWDF